MSLYSYESLKRAAEEAGCWIDVRDEKVRRGHEVHNTDKKERISRALSWHKKSEESADADERLIFAFIAFNALYATANKEEERTAMANFLSVLADGKQRGEIFEFALAEIKNLEKILSSQYLSMIYWKDEGGMREKSDKMARQKKWAKNRARDLIKSRDIAPVRAALFRMHLLRSQLLHGMAAYTDSYNRRQVKLCAEFLHPLVGRMIRAAICDKTLSLGDVPYPPQGYPNESRVEVEKLESGQ